MYDKNNIKNSENIAVCEDSPHSDFWRIYFDRTGFTDFEVDGTSSKHSVTMWVTVLESSFEVIVEELLVFFFFSSHGCFPAVVKAQVCFELAVSFEFLVNSPD